MGEPEYWARLEFRISREFSAMSENCLRFRWCDGFMPQRYQLSGPSPYIRGRAWICNGPIQEQWEFTLFLRQSVDSRSGIDWSSLLPPENVTKWIAVDLPGKRIEIEPSAAVPDGPE
jgi:hypothetical protein